MRKLTFTIFLLLIVCSSAKGQRVENTSLQVPLDINQLPLLLSETGIFEDLELEESEREDQEEIIAVIEGIQRSDEQVSDQRFWAEEIDSIIEIEIDSITKSIDRRKKTLANTEDQLSSSESELNELKRKREDFLHEIQSDTHVQPSQSISSGDSKS